MHDFMLIKLAKYAYKLIKYSYNLLAYKLSTILLEDVLTLYKLIKNELNSSISIKFSLINPTRIIISPVQSRLYGMSFFSQSDGSLE